ncbi:serine hydrolase [Robertmurraya sp. FSL W8-0741]|uniref:serine hydrolase domain-containing protein n=1 Tax=Robertmurraya TaxID=2837507 RepID=UPI0010F5E717|nr:serine hydrolase [Robertmurraya siralis]
MQTRLLEKIKNVQNENEFSGSVLVANEMEQIIELSFGYANRSEQLKNHYATRFGIASGCKIFTAVGICQLVEKGKLSFSTRLDECLNVEFPHFDKRITIHHLLTHTAGIPDYFDEEVMDDFEELWLDNPMYKIRSLRDFLPLFQNKPMKLNVGERFHYNNAGYILLGLIIEQASGQAFSDYIQTNIFPQADMMESGYFEFDALPSNTSVGYIDFPDGTWKTNIYSLPAKGGSDGGAYVTVNDMGKFWNALVNGHIIRKETLEQMLTPHAQADEEEDHYGYGVWIEKKGKEVHKYHVMGYDPGVSFHSAFYPSDCITVVVCSNKSEGAYGVMKGIEQIISEERNK